MSQSEECGFEVEEEEKEDDVVETKRDTRLQRRQRTRGVHRKRKQKVLAVAGRADVLSSRARHARKRGRPEALVLSGAAKTAHRKKQRLERRFHVRDAEQNGNGEE